MLDALTVIIILLLFSWVIIPVLYILCIATVGVGAGVTAVLAAVAAFVHWVRAATGKRRAVYVAATLGLLLFLYTMFFTEL